MSLGRSTVVRLVALCIVWGAAAPSVDAARLPVRRFTAADGLAGDFVIGIYRDSRGALWFSTRDGVSRFDGALFTSYDLSDGLPQATINDVLESRAGIFWLGTNGGGLARLNPGGPDRFTVYPVGTSLATNRVNRLLEDSAGRLWIGTDGGLFVHHPGQPDGAFEAVPLAPEGQPVGVGSMVLDGEGGLWVGGLFGLRRRLPDGRLITYSLDPMGSRDHTTALLLDAEQRLWVGFVFGLVCFTPEPGGRFAGEPSPLLRQIPRDGVSSSAVGNSAWLTSARGLPDDHVSALVQSATGEIWIGTARGLAVLDGGRLTTFAAASGLPEIVITAIREDMAGNLWLGTVAGAARLTRPGLVTYDEGDGLGHSRIRSIREDATGALTVVTGDFGVSRFDGERFTSVQVRIPVEAACNWLSPCGFLDAAGGWWMMTTAGLRYWRARSHLLDLAGRAPDRILTTRDGLPSDNVSQAFGDSRGRLWIGFVPGGVSTWDTREERWHTYTEADGLPPAESFVGRVTAFAEDRVGQIWIGFEGTTVVRLRGGRFEPLSGPGGASALNVTALHVDAAGRLWLGSSISGLGRIDDPAAVRPVVRWLGRSDGLASDNVRAVASGSDGRIYAGTSRGVDRLDPVSGGITHFTVGEGLSSQFVTAAFRDRHGHLWFGTVNGLSRLDPSKEPARPVGPAPPVFIARLRAAGSLLSISDLGDPAPPPFDLAPDRNQLEIEFFAYNFQSGAPLRYAYRLDGADADWSAPSELHAVNYARLAAGSYRFLVRAVTPSGSVSTEPAVVAFAVLPPFYLTWWFIGLCGLAAVAAVAGAYRMRVRQLLRVERVRARIATDLHDDIGASLSQIAILAEVARRAPSRADGPADPLGRIADTSRDLVDSMSDIVWAINPEADRLTDLVGRMRRFAEDTLGASDIRLTFEAPADHDLPLGADIRRDVLLLFKECVTNVAKHAECRTATVELGLDGRHLRLEVSDDGKGFDPDASTDGNGLASMRRRVAGHGGHLQVDSAPGSGTTVRFEFELPKW